MTIFDARPAIAAPTSALRRDRTGGHAPARLVPFFRIVVVIQGVHVVEHIVQFLQVNVFGVPSERAFGLLGYVFQLNGTAEWLHLVFNAAYVCSLYVIGVRLLLLRRQGYVPVWAVWVFGLYGVLLETWHMVEHVVIISNVVRNHGCPCPGIGDRALGVTDIQLHLGYNTITYSAVVATYVLVRKAAGDGRRADATGGTTR